MHQTSLLFPNVNHTNTAKCPKTLHPCRLSHTCHQFTAQTIQQFGRNSSISKWPINYPRSKQSKKSPLNKQNNLPLNVISAGDADIGSWSGCKFQAGRPAYENWVAVNSSPSQLISKSDGWNSLGLVSVLELGLGSSLEQGLRVRFALGTRRLLNRKRKRTNVARSQNYKLKFVTLTSWKILSATQVHEVLTRIRPTWYNFNATLSLYTKLYERCTV